MNKADKPMPRSNTSWPNWPLERVIAFFMITSGAVIFFYLWTFWRPSFSSVLEHWGQTGDFFGGILNPIVSFCTLVVAVAVWRLQKNELADTRMELQAQRSQQRFFDLINIYHQTVGSVSSFFVRTITREIPGAKIDFLTGHRAPHLDFYEDVGSEAISLAGKAAISHKLAELESLGDDGIEINWLDLVSKAINPSSDSTSNALELLKSEWVSQQTNMHLTHYFRVVTLLLSEAKNLLGADEHHRYVALFVAQLTPDELVVLGYYMWLDSNGHELTSLAQTYGLLQNMTKRKRSLNSVLPPTVFTRPTP